MAERSSEAADSDSSDVDTSPIFSGQRVSKGKRRERESGTGSDDDADSSR